MIDSSIPYFDVTMVRPKHAADIPVPTLPNGYTYAMYAPGNEQDWSRIETAVREFDATEQATAYFQKEFAPFAQELPRRMVFIENEAHIPVADATAWWKDDPALGRVALLHWVAVIPSEQGRGLGRAVTSMALSRFAQVGPHTDIWLSTQTWSHVAIGLYLSLGFQAHRSMMLDGHENRFDDAAAVLRSVMPKDAFDRFIQTAIS